MQRIARTYDRLLALLAVAVGVMIVASMLFVVVDVLLRFFFGAPIGWVIEVCEYFLLFTPFLGMAWLVRQVEGHIRIDVLVQGLGRRTQAVLDCWGSCLVGATLAFGAYYTGISAWGHILRNVQTPGVYPIPKGYLMFVITAGFALTAVEFLRKARGHYREARSDRGAQRRSSRT